MRDFGGRGCLESGRLNRWSLLYIFAMSTTSTILLILAVFLIIPLYSFFITTRQTNSRGLSRNYVAVKLEGAKTSKKKRLGDVNRNVNNGVDLADISKELRRVVAYGAEKNERVYCAMPVHWNSLEHSKLDAVLETWASSCDVHKVFVPFSERPPKEYVSPNGRRVEIVPLHLTYPSHCGDKPCRNIYDVMRHVWAHVYEHERNSADWFVKTDTDSFVWPSNIRKLVRKRGWKPSHPYYFGHVLRHASGSVAGSLMVAGSSTVFSSETLRRFATSLHTGACKNRKGVEEPPLGGCLYSLGVNAKDAFDDEGRESFMVLPIRDHLSRTKAQMGKFVSWYVKNIAQNHWGEDCCSSSPVSFHYIRPHEMRDIYEFLVTRKKRPSSYLNDMEVRYLKKVGRP